MVLPLSANLKINAVVETRLASTSLLVRLDFFGESVDFSSHQPAIARIFGGRDQFFKSYSMRGIQSGGLWYRNVGFDANSLKVRVRNRLITQANGTMMRNFELMANGHDGFAPPPVVSPTVLARPNI
jgi:hypothetical protein